jgi:hypothetical protein
MLLYEIDGQILTIRVFGSPTVNDRESFFEAIRRDPGVVEDMHVIYDVREVDPGRELTAGQRGWICAVIVPPGFADQSMAFQETGRPRGLRVELFTEEKTARRWLSYY